MMYSSEHQHQDIHYMKRVLKLAQLGLNTTQPNPMVACVIVKDNEILSEAYHQQTGQYHAEREAINKLGENARGATAYVNLEPCCHQGRTPPCTDALIDAGVEKVVVAMQDPNPLVSGSGFEILSEAGIEVKVGVLEQEAKWLNKGFVSRMALNKPWVTLKTAATLDGRTADIKGESQWISSEASRQDVQKIRARSSAIITGIGTVLADNPSLNVRYKASHYDHIRQAKRVVLDSQLRIPLDANIIGDDASLFVFTTSKNQHKVDELRARGVEVIQTKKDQNKHINLLDVLSELAKWECNEVLVEAGQTLAGQFIQADLVDELLLYYAPSILGNQAKPMFSFDQAVEFSQRKKYEMDSVDKIGMDIRVNLMNQNSKQTILEV